MYILFGIFPVRKKMCEKGTFTVGMKFKLENIYKILQTILM